MAKSKFEYVKQFEIEDKLLPNCWIVVRVKGKGLHRFSEVHSYIKPNDDRALDLMSKAAETVMEEYKDIMLAYGQSNEYSFVFKKHTKVYNRRASKLSTYVGSVFASSFAFFWPRYFNTQMLQYPPTFDSRTILYPTDKNLQDYLSWRQIDCHINNLYNTCYWKLIQGKGYTPAQSQERLKGTMSSDMNELLLKEFEINYNNLPALYQKGTILVRGTKHDSVNVDLDLSGSFMAGQSERSHGPSTGTIGDPIMSKKNRSIIERLHVDLIAEEFSEMLSTNADMIKSKFEYLKQFEIQDRLLPDCWIVVRIDGKGFHRFSEVHSYIKPNDDRALDLMSKAAETVMEEFKDIVLAYGQSDEYSFVFKKNTKVYNRRASKLASTVGSLFTTSYVFSWHHYFGTQTMQYPPAFDSRTVLYPADKNLQDYLSWRQADCHINNLYNTCFWKLIQEKGYTPAQSQERLKGTMSNDKNELLFKEFEINYNNLQAVHRKGTILVCSTKHDRENDDLDLSLHFSGLSTARQSERGHGPSTGAIGDAIMSKKTRPIIEKLHVDLIGKQFWTDHPEILSLNDCFVHASPLWGMLL